MVIVTCPHRGPLWLCQFSSFWGFYAPGLQGPPGASSNRIVRPFVCPSVCPSVRNSVPLLNKVQYLKFGWWYSNQTWTVSSSIGSSHFTDIPSWEWGGQGQNEGLRDFCHIWTLLMPGASVFHKHMSSFFLLFDQCRCILTVDTIHDKHTLLDLPCVELISI